MSKIYNISIILSFLGLWLTSTIPDTLQIFLGLFLILTFGILHGSNDILLMETITHKNIKNAFSKMLFLYILVVLVAIAVFYFIPSLALLLFIIFSAFHFGEQHWENKFLPIHKWVKQLFYLTYGFFILMFLFFFNIAEVQEVIISITGYSVNNNSIIYSFLTSVIMFCLVYVYVFYKCKNCAHKLLVEIFYIGIFGILFSASTLIWGFAIYFIFWHSIPSLFEQIIFIYGNFNKNSILRYCKNAFIYWFISLISVVTMIYIFKDDTLLYAILFSFIAAVTFPHSLIMNKMFKNKKRN